jgi:Protein of unknown function (DUF1800)
MTRFGLALGVTALLATAASTSGTAASRFDQKLAKEKQVLHALNRLTFGPRPGDVERVGRLGVERWIQQQLQPQLIAENPILEVRLRPLDTLRLATWQILEKYQQQFPPGAVVNGATLVVNGVAFRRPLPQLVSAEQLNTLSTGTPEQRAAVLGAIDPEHLGTVMSSLAPKMLEGLPVSACSRSHV